MALRDFKHGDVVLYDKFGGWLSAFREGVQPRGLCSTSDQTGKLEPLVVGGGCECDVRVEVV